MRVRQAQRLQDEQIEWLESVAGQGPKACGKGRRPGGPVQDVGTTFDLKVEATEKF